MNLFRKIRKELAAQNKIQKYLRYAIGEIILVVIGILIALQINNWNEERKLKKVEINTLKELKAALIESKNNLHLAIDDEEIWLTYNLTILEYLEEQKPYSTDLDICFGSYFWSSKLEVSTTAYEQLKNKGLELISNHELMKKISHIFEKRFAQVKAENEIWDYALLNSVIYPQHVTLFRKYFPAHWKPGQDEYAKPLNYEALFENKTFINTIAEQIALKRFGLLTSKQIVEDIAVLIREIDAELIRIKN